MIRSHNASSLLLKSTKIICLALLYSTCLINSTVISATINRRHPDVSPCRPQALRVSLSKKTLSSAVQRNLFSLNSSDFSVFRTIGRSLIFVEGSGQGGCHCSPIDCYSFLSESLGTLSFFLLCYFHDSEIKNVLC